MRVAVLGAGVMGAGMVTSLRRAGHEVAVWNRTASRAAELRPTGAVAADSVAAAVNGADAVVTVLFDAAATLAVKDELVGALRPGAVWIQAGTLGLDGIAEVAAGVAALVDAPVLGTRKPALDGALTVLVSGDPGLIETARPVFEAIGARTIVAGDTVGRATALKLVCNAWVASITAAVGQSVRLAEALGVDPRQFLEAIDGAPVGAPYAQVKGVAMIGGDYATSFAVDGVVKDVGLMVDAAAGTGFSPELLVVVRELFERAASSGYGSDDMAAVAEAFGKSS